MRRIARWLVFSTLSVAWTSVFCAEVPDHYFVGKVCKANSEVEVFRADHPCKHPLPEVTVTAHNSHGEAATTSTDRHGAFALQPIALYGTAEDYVLFELPKHVSLKVPQLTYSKDVEVDPEAGALVLLPKQRTIRVSLGGAHEQTGAKPQ
jgi:hypothetical protein